MPALSTIRPLVLAAVLLPLAPLPALAAAATATQNVNMRSGPDTTFSVVAQLQQGDAVDISKCQGSFCEVTSGAHTGWVSAAYLTRDVVQKPAPKLIPSEPQVASVAPAAPKAAATPPGLQAPARPDAFPPAYEGKREAVPPLDAPERVPQDAEVAPLVVDPAPVPVRAPDGFADVPRPKVDIPDAGPAAPGDDYADDQALPGDDGRFVAPSPAGEWADGGPPPERFRHFRRGAGRDFASFDAPDSPAQACFVDADGGPAFCVREGEHLADVARFGGDALLLRNPDGLNVTVCTTAAYHDCRTYVESGPVILGGGREIASVSAAAPGY